MKKIFAVLLLSGFAIAVCHAGPYDHGITHKTELSKKHFDLQPFEMVQPIEVPAAPMRVYDLIVPGITTTEKIVVPHSNSPPKKRTALSSYSMAVRYLN